MLETGETHPSASLEIVVEVAPQRAAESTDEVEQATVGAFLE
jgi:hypothetical protein